MLRGTTTSRSLWVALAVLAVCQLLQVLPVYRGIERQLALPGVTALLIHSLVVAAAAAARTLYNSLEPGRSRPDRRHLWWAVAAWLLLAGLYTAAPPRQVPAALTGRAEYYDGSVLTALAWLVYLTYLSWALVGMLACTRRFARQAQPGPLRTGLRVGAAGVVVGFGYVALKLTVVGLWLAGHGPAVVRFDAVAEAAVLSGCLLLIGTGSAYEGLAFQLDRARQAARRARSLRRLAPLARQLQQDLPSAGYTLPVDGDQQRLILLVTEIRDAQRALRGFLDPDLVEHAAAAARVAGHHAGQLDALAEAAGLELARRAKTSGARPRPSVLREPAGGRGLLEEVACLERLAAAYRHPFVRDYADRHQTVPTPPQRAHPAPDHRDTADA